MVQHIGAAVGPRLGELQALADGGGPVTGVQQPRQRRNEPADGLLVELVLTATRRPPSALDRPLAASHSLWASCR